MPKNVSTHGRGLLIESDMSAIQPDVFSGIEMQSYPANADSSLLGKFFKKQSSKRLTVIGPANQLKTLKKDRNLISALVSASK